MEPVLAGVGDRLRHQGRELGPDRRLAFALRSGAVRSDQHQEHSLQPAARGPLGEGYLCLFVSLVSPWDTVSWRAPQDGSSRPCHQIANPLRIVRQFQPRTRRRPRARRSRRAPPATRAWPRLGDSTALEEVARGGRLGAWNPSAQDEGRGSHAHRHPGSSPRPPRDARRGEPRRHAPVRYLRLGGRRGSGPSRRQPMPQHQEAYRTAPRALPVSSGARTARRRPGPGGEGCDRAGSVWPPGPPV